MPYTNRPHRWLYSRIGTAKICLLISVNLVPLLQSFSGSVLVVCKIQSISQPWDRLENEALWEQARSNNKICKYAFFYIAANSINAMCGQILALNKRLLTVVAALACPNRVSTGHMVGLTP